MYKRRDARLVPVARRMETHSADRQLLTANCCTEPGVGKSAIVLFGSIMCLMRIRMEN
ncbi:hypothetical protein CHELA40_14515 [Chelatococcus asaccharovorans]|nr:hypothetical protein CHELA17_61105 [Chelatococcus asaccharovorans]CAH1678069.1 hypothetical protein CHELA40_14515 [Chelatococcus asaccharovorans]